jgi:hypothetical protein
MNQSSQPEFAELKDRIKAIYTDMVIYVIFIFVVSAILDNIENVPTSIRIIAFVFIFIIYDPLFTSSFGGTIGHLVNRLRVKRSSDMEKKIIFPVAVIRFVIKALLGLSRCSQFQQT